MSSHPGQPRPDPPPQPPIHATNAWNPTGRNLLALNGTRLYYAHAETLNGQRTFVLLGDQQHLTFVADLEGHVEPAALRSTMLGRFGLYPHQIDLEPRTDHPQILVRSRPLGPSRQ